MLRLGTLSLSLLWFWWRLFCRRDNQWVLSNGCLLCLLLFCHSTLCNISLHLSLHLFIKQLYLLCSLLWWHIQHQHTSVPCSWRYFSTRANNSALVPLVGSPNSPSLRLSSGTYKPTDQYIVSYINTLWQGEDDGVKVLCILCCVSLDLHRLTMGACSSLVPRPPSHPLLI